MAQLDRPLGYSDFLDLYATPPRPRPRFPLGRLWMVLGALAFVLGAGGTTYALSVAATANQGAISTTALSSPTGLSGAQSGSDVQLNWTAATPNNGNGYSISGMDNGASTTCPTSASAYTTFVGGAAASAVTYTDSTSPLLGVPNGNHVCYLVQSAFNPAGPPPWASAPGWTSLNSLPTVAVTITQILHVQSGPERTGRTSATASVSAGTKAGDLLVAEVFSDVTGITAPAGWTRAVQVYDPSAGNSEIWYRKNVPAGLTTARFNCAACAAMAAEMAEFSGASKTAPLDTTGTKVDNTGVNAAVTVTSAATAGSYDLGVAAIGDQGVGSQTPGAGWTHLFNDPVNGVVADYRLMNPGGAVSDTETANVTTAWVAAIATFQR